MGDSTPICRCRVLYLGSAVPRQSKDGLQGIQEPLRSLYPSEGAVGAKGIDSWLSVWSNGILLENVDENRKQVTRFFPIESLHYCAAVRQVLIPERGNTNPEPKFLPLDSPFARTPKAQHPPIFAAILRRTTGIKVLECHVFICKREAAANALVRCCFHAYADNSYAKQLEGGSSGSVYGTIGGAGKLSTIDNNEWRSRTGSTTTLSTIGRMNGSGGGVVGGGSSVNGISDSFTVKNLYASSADLDVVDDGDISIYNSGDENHKVWSGSQDRLDSIAIMESPYDFYSGSVGGANGIISGGASTLGRAPRARQISAPMTVAPPPPPQKDESNSKKRGKDSKKMKNIGSQSLSGTLIRPKPVHGSTLMRNIQYHHHQQQQQHHPHMIYGPPIISGGPLPPPRQFHTISHRSGVGGGGGGGGMYSNGGSLYQIPIGSHPNLHQIHQQKQFQHHLHLQQQQQQQQQQQHHQQHQLPILIPQQYATLQHSKNLTKKKKKDKNMMNGGGIPVGVPIVPSTLFAAYPAAPQSMIGSEPRPLIMSKKLAQSAGAGLDIIEISPSGEIIGQNGGLIEDGNESPGGTGIYRRKGHLNERAFSYSIRQEHRSRSHGSLASLQFNPPDMKKEREIAQMVAGLDLNDGSSSTLNRRLVNGNINISNNSNSNNNNSNNGPIPIPASGNKPRR